MASDRRRIWLVVWEGIRELPRAARVYVLFMFVTALGIPLTVLGALSDNRTMLIVGLILAGLSVVSSAVVLPIILARDSARQNDK